MFLALQKGEESLPNLYSGSQKSGTRLLLHKFFEEETRCAERVGSGGRALHFSGEHHRLANKGDCESGSRWAQARLKEIRKTVEFRKKGPHEGTTNTLSYVVLLWRKLGIGYSAIVGSALRGRKPPPGGDPRVFEEML